MGEARGTGLRVRLLVSVLSAVVLTAIVAWLWLGIGGNAAGWATSILVGIFVGIVPTWTGIDDAFLNLSKRAQTMLLVLATAFAVAGGIMYVLHPGTASWYLWGLPGFPVVVLLIWLQGDSDSGAGAGGLSDGPWTAP